MSATIVAPPPIVAPIAATPTPNAIGAAAESKAASGVNHELGAVATAPTASTAPTATEAAIESGCPVGSHIEVKWPRKWYSGVVTEYDISNDEHYIKYDDGKDEQFEDLTTMRWKFVHAPEPVPVAAPAAPSMLWRAPEPNSFIDQRGNRKTAVVHDVDAALSRVTNGLVQQLPHSVDCANEVIDKFMSAGRRGNVSTREAVDWEGYNANNCCRSALNG